MSSFVKYFEPFSFTSKSLTVGVGYHVLVRALFAACITTQILMLCSPLGTILPVDLTMVWSSCNIFNDIFIFQSFKFLVYLIMQSKGDLLFCLSYRCYRRVYMKFYTLAFYLLNVISSLISFHLFFLCVAVLHIVNSETHVLAFINLNQT